MSTLLNIPKHSEIKIVRPKCLIIDPPRQLNIRRISKKLSRRQNTYFSIIKFKKLCQKIIDYVTS